MLYISISHSSISCDIIIYYVDNIILYSIVSYYTILYIATSYKTKACDKMVCYTIIQYHDTKLYYNAP